LWNKYGIGNGLLNDGVSHLAINQVRDEIWFDGGGDGVTRLKQYYGLDEKVFLPLTQK
jgi:hypothetical protein